jgi:hypothetical protein
MPAIFDHHIDDMLTAGMRAIGKEDLKEEATGRAVREALESCWVDTGAITWTIYDILGEYPALTRAQARDVLSEMVHEHDASVGISWDNMGPYVRRVVPDYDGEAEDAVILARLKAHAARLATAGGTAAVVAAFGCATPDFDAAAIDDIDFLRETYQGLIADIIAEDDEDAGRDEEG